MGKIISVRGPDNLKEKLDQLSKKRGFTRNALILKALWEYVDKETKASNINVEYNETEV